SSGGRASTAGSGGLVLTSPAGTAGASGEGGVPPAVEVDCVSSAQCAQPFPYCVSAIGRCVECLSHNNCTGTGRTLCDTRTNECVSCLNDMQCPNATPYCSTSIGQCVECLTSTNCGRSGVACDRNSFRCVPTCQNNTDCES